MRADFVILAEAAVASDGRLFIHGGGWNALASENFPLRIPNIAAASRLILDDDEIGRAFKLGVDIVGEDGHSILGRHLESTVATKRTGADEDNILCAAFTIGPADFPQTGAYRLVILVDGGVVAETALEIRQRPAPRAVVQEPAQPSSTDDEEANPVGAVTPAGERRHWTPARNPGA